MDQTPLDDLAFQVRHRLIDYLKAARLHLDESDPADIRTTCPCCSRMALVLEALPGTPMPTWECGFCGKKGNAIDYAQAYFGMTEKKAIIDVCRRLGIRITHLETITAASLMDKQFDPQHELIEGMLAPGLYILAGASKIGKSWLVLQIAHCVSMGLPLWERKVQKSEVLYLALEDTERRIQNRLMRICGGETGAIAFATDAEKLSQGFEEQVTNYLRKHPQVKLVIVDTLIKVREMNSRGSAYADDYATMTAFKRIAERYGITMLIVHHTRKQEAGDIMDMISGTTGIMGCADGAMVLERPMRRVPKGSISMTGRDFQDAKISLTQNPETMCWEFVGYTDELPEEQLDPVLSAIAMLIEQQELWEGTAEELCVQLQTLNPRLNLKANALSRRLNAQMQELENQCGVRFSRSRGTNGRQIRLEAVDDVYDNDDVSDIG